jgi:hypothetical protein
MKQSKFVDLIISEAAPSLQQKLKRDYRICSITKKGTERYINLRIPAEVQDKILQAYSQGKQVRIFA